jgi:catechol 2,3-dioxygenase-like lactoylglutathione lyase family enzyme
MADAALGTHAAFMEITGLDHVQIAIPGDGLETARAFYGDVLGFAEEARPAMRSPGLWVRAPRTILHLARSPHQLPPQHASNPPCRTTWRACGVRPCSTGRRGPASARTHTNSCSTTGLRRTATKAGEEIGLDSRGA